MSSDPRHPDENGDEALDRLLARAAWPGAPEESTGRLSAYWQRISPAQDRRRVLRRVIPIASAAAVVMAAALVGLLLKRGGPVPDGTGVAVTNPSSDSRDVVHPVLHVPADSSPYAPRPLTDRDRLLLHLASLSPRPAHPEQSATDILVQGLLADVIDNPMHGRPAVWRLRDHARRAEERLVEDLATADGVARRLDDVRLLASIASARSLPVLVALARDAHTRHAAMPAVLRLADAPTLAMLARQAPAAPEGRDLLAAMLRREPKQAVRLLLPLIKEPATLPAALGGLDSIATDPRVRRNVAAALMEELQGPRVEDRLAAARALGRFNDPETAARLADMAQRNVSRREALVALIWSGPRSAAASAALDSARRSARLSSTVRSLEITMSDARSTPDPRPAFSPAILDTDHSS
jgi:hypothetical protein